VALGMSIGKPSQSRLLDRWSPDWKETDGRTGRTHPSGHPGVTGGPGCSAP